LNSWQGKICWQRGNVQENDLKLNIHLLQFDTSQCRNYQDKNTCMSENKIISAKTLSEYGKIDTLNDQAFTLVKQQCAAWELAGKNYDALREVQTRTFDFEYFRIIAQHNPGRMRSSAAKTDAQSIKSRPCFLCMQNLPEEQKGIPFGKDYLVLANPFPIFPYHLTIPHYSHFPQKIDGFFGDMLDLSRQLTGMVVFYNGPECGASAPDHFHFQAGSRGLLPIESEIVKLEDQYAQPVIKSGNLKVFAVENYLRRFISIVSSSKDEMIHVFEFLYSLLPSADGKEPMLNVLSYYDNNKWRIILFPRGKQRPSHFFQTGEGQIIVGPAAVELGGILVLPRPEDFELITQQTISEIYNEVTLPENEFYQWIAAAEKYS
jgi:ATP adenylyltransferase/5',5'''-P-1,P-4-tetraphosphate phosphorylase II